MTKHETSMTVFCFLLVICPPPNPPTRNYSQWTRNHALYWIRSFHFYHSYGYNRSSGLRSVICSDVRPQSQSYHGLFSVCSHFYSWSYVLRTSLRTVAFVGYALSRCAIADRFPLIHQRAFLSVNGSQGSLIDLRLRYESKVGCMSPDGLLRSLPSIEEDEENGLWDCPQGP